MQSEYPLSVLIVVPPWPGPVEQNPEPTTPTGPPRPAAAAAATLSRYQGYIERSVEYHRCFSQSSLVRSHRVPSYSWNLAKLLTPGHTFSLLLFSVSLSVYYFSAIRTRHAVRGTHLTADGITAPRIPRAVSPRYTPRSRTTLRARASRGSARQSREEQSLAFAYACERLGTAHSR